MKKRMFKQVILAAGLSVALAGTAAAQMALDLDSKAGDQGARDARVKAGDVVNIQLVSTQPFKGLLGVEIELKFDKSKVQLKGFKPSGAMAGGMSMPPGTSAEGAKISAALMGKSADSEASVTLGELSFSVDRGIGDGTAIELVSGSFGSAAGTQKFDLKEGVQLYTGDKPPTQHKQEGSSSGGQGGPMGGPMGPPPGGHQMGGSQGGPMGQPSAEEMKKMYEQWRRSPEAKDLNGDRQVNEEDFKIFTEKMMKQAGPQGGPMGPPSGGQGGSQGGPMGGPMGPPSGGHQMGGPQGGPMGGPQGGPKGEPSAEEMKKMYEQWRRSPEAKDLNGDRQVNEEDFKIFAEKMMKQGGPMGPPSGGQGGPMGGPMGSPPGGHQMGGPQGGPMGGPMGSHQEDYPNPHKLIETLPAGLQPSFNKTLDTESEAEKAHMEAELKMLTSVRQTLEETKRYLVKASDAEKDQILKVLSFFDRQGQHDGPGMGPGGPGMGGPGMGGPGMGQGAGKAASPANAEDLVRKMIEDTDREMENLKQMMQEMGR